MLSVFTCKYCVVVSCVVVFTWHYVVCVRCCDVNQQACQSKISRRHIVTAIGRLPGTGYSWHSITTLSWKRSSSSETMSMVLLQRYLSTVLIHESKFDCVEPKLSLWLDSNGSTHHSSESNNWLQWVEQVNIRHATISDSLYFHSFTLISSVYPSGLNL